MKVVINSCFGGFGLSQSVIKRAQELGVQIDNHGFQNDWQAPLESIRSDARLIQAIEEAGIENARDNSCAKLKIVEIPDDIEWEIDDYDGLESIHEKHKVWD